MTSTYSSSHEREFNVSKFYKQVEHIYQPIIKPDYLEQLKRLNSEDILKDIGQSYNNEPPPIDLNNNINKSYNNTKYDTNIIYIK